MAQRQLPEGPRTKGTATGGPEGPESGQNMRVRGPEGPEDELSRVPVLGACQCYPVNPVAGKWVIIAGINCQSNIANCPANIPLGHVILFAARTGFSNGEVHFGV